jgi:hypothetical protein
MTIKFLFFIGCSFDVGCQLNFRRLAGMLAPPLSAEIGAGELQIEPSQGLSANEKNLSLYLWEFVKGRISLAGSL